MIASLRGLVVLAVIAAALALAVVVDSARSTGPIDRALVHFDVAKIQRLAWPDLVATRTGATWKAGDVTLDAAAIADVLRTLEAARWHRRGGAAGKVHTTLEVDHTTIGIADALPGTDQTWLVVAGRPLLVDGWVARALVPGALALHVRHPFASARRSNVLVIGGVSLHGHPRTLADGQLADVGAVTALEAALADAEVVALDAARATGTQVTLDSGTTTIGGACTASAELVAVSGPYGNGCVAHGAVDRILEAARAAAATERRPVWFAAISATLAGGAEVDLRGEAASALVHALATPAADVASAGAAPEVTHLVVTGARGEHGELRVLPHNLVERTADGAMLRLAHADWLALQAPASTYADPTRWSEDPTAVEAIGVAGVTYHRGTVLGEWTPAAPLAPAALDALAAALSHVEARDAQPAPTAHAFTVTLAPPVGALQTHTLELGAKCAGRIDGKPVTFEAATCQALERAVR